SFFDGHTLICGDHLGGRRRRQTVVMSRVIFVPTVRLFVWLPQGDWYIRYTLPFKSLYFLDGNPPLIAGVLSLDKATFKKPADFIRAMGKAFGDLAGSKVGFFFHCCPFPLKP